MILPAEGNWMGRGRGQLRLIKRPTAVLTNIFGGKVHLGRR